MRRETRSAVASVRIASDYKGSHSARSLVRGGSGQAERIVRRRSGFQIVTALALLILAWPTSATAEKPSFRLTVTVVYANGQPVPGAAVTVTHDRIGPELRPYDHRLETDTNGVASTVITPEGVGEGVVYWPKLNIEAKKGARVATDSVKVPGQRLTSGVRYPDVARTLTIQGDEETERAKINIAVTVSSDTKAIEGANISIKGPQGTYTGRIGADGKVNIAVPFIPKGEYWVEATRRGYETKGRMFVLDRSPASSTIDSPITLKETATPDGVLVTFNVKRAGGPEPVREAHITLSGVTGNALDDYSKTTNSDGIAKMRVPGYGTFNVTITQDTYEPFSGQIQLGYGEREKSFDFALKEKRSEETVTITVVAGDIKNGRGGYQPIRGASVTAGSASGTTDRDGKVTLNVKSGVVESDKRAGYAEAVDVQASADGYKSERRSVQLVRSSQDPGSGAATFVLQPGEDEAAADTPLKVVVQVRDALGNGVARADVKLASLGSGFTDGAGNKDFDSGNRKGAELEALRRGLTLKVTRAGFKDNQSDIPPSMLKPSKEPCKYEVRLDNDWTELTKAIASLEEDIEFWKNEAAGVASKAKSVDALSAKCAAARGRAEALLAELKAARKAFDAKVSESGCKEAAAAAKSIQTWQTEAIAKEKALRSALDEAINLAATCKSKADADSIIAKHRSAIRLAADIGKLEKQAQASNQKLTSLVQNNTGSVSLPAQLQQTVDKIESEVSAVGKDAVVADNDFDQALRSSKALPGRRAGFLQTLDRLRADHYVWVYQTILPADIRKRLDGLEAVLRSGGNDMSLSYVPSIDRSRLDVIKESVSRLQEYKNEAAAIVAGFKGVSCNVQPLDGVVQEIGSMVVGASIELGAAGDLPERAVACQTAAAAVSPSRTPSDDVTVPDVSVFTGLVEMKAAATHAGLVPGLVATKATPPSGSTRLFAGQDPPANTKVKKGSSLKILVYQQVAQPSPSPSPSPSAIAKTSPSPSEDEVRVPDLSIFDGIVEMKAAAAQVGLVPALAATKATPPPGATRLFAGQDPPAGSKAKRGAPLKILIYQKSVTAATPSPSPSATASAVAAGNMPNLIGLTLEQATTRLSGNMTIVSDSIGDKPPVPEKALTIFAQIPAANTKIAPDQKIGVTVKRYGSAQTSSPPSEQASGNFEGSWGGTFLLSTKPEQLVIKITRGPGGYVVAPGQYEPQPAHLENGSLVFSYKRTIFRITYTCSLQGADELKPRAQITEQSGAVTEINEMGSWHRVK